MKIRLISVLLALALLLCMSLTPGASANDPESYPYLGVDGPETVRADAVTKLTAGIILVFTTMVLSIILMITVADWMFPIVLTMLGLGIYLIYYILKHSRVEYEYTFVTGELRIARINR